MVRGQSSVPGTIFGLPQDPQGEYISCGIPGGAATSNSSPARLRLGYGCRVRCGYTARMSDSSPESAPLDLRPLPGSEQRALPRAIRAADPVPADTVIAVTLVLRRRAELPDPAAAAPVA